MYQTLCQYNIITARQTVNPKFKTIVDVNGLLESIISHTEYLSPNASLKERIIAIKTGISQAPRCSNPDCDNLVKFIESGKARNTYHAFCSLKCSNSSEAVKQKKTKTTQENFGVDNPSQSSVIKQKKIQTSIAKFGTNYPWQHESVKNLKIANFQKTYGVDNPMHLETVKQHQQIIRKESDWYQSVQHTDYYNLLRNKNWLVEQHHTQQKTATQISNELQVSQTLVLMWLHKHGIEIKQYFTSSQQQELIDFLHQLNISIDVNNRTVIAPYELDVVCHDRKIAIEYDGIFWHSEGLGNSRITPSYHLHKTQMCEEQGYRLIHVFENEWINQTDIVKNRLRHAFGIVPSRTIYGRQCVVKTIPKQECVEFLKQHHIQGSCSSSIEYGLYYVNELVAVMTFGKSRYDKSYQYELLRFTVHGQCNVVGACGKLLAHFIKHHNPQSIISYADRRWSQGNVYKSIGMQYISASKPNYFYIDPTRPLELQSRLKYQKYKLPNILPKFDSNLSEKDNMFNNGFRRIWDCGNLKFAWVK